jgi:hypothetical protein
MELFSEILDKLDPEDIVIMDSMLGKEATSQFSALDKSDILKDLNLTESAFRKSITRLEAVCFIGIVTGKRRYSYYLSKFGSTAIEKITEGMNVK